jgi:hypothetical protein
LELRLDFIPREFAGPDGRYQPLKTDLTIPDVPRDQVICFCLYTTHRGVLKLNVQLYPLRDGEERRVRLEIERDGGWLAAGEAEVNPVGWSALLRVEEWDDSRPARYRVSHAGGSRFEGLIRANPIEKDEIVVANLSGNSKWDRNPRPDVIANLKALDPDLLFFAGDQSYDEADHLGAWLLFGRQFGEITRDRPTVTIPDDHDVGQWNLWGQNGVRSSRIEGDDGGYFMPVEYVNMVQRQQTAHLPDPYDPTPVQRGITVYYTSLSVGGVDFAILEDRKWKTGPAAVLKPRGERPDHVTDPAYDPQELDVPEADLLGPRQIAFLRAWAQDWDAAEFKCVLSQSTFGGTAHVHGRKQLRVLADLDCNGWPQSGRDEALREIRKAFAFMMCGDQHLASVVHHGVENWGDAAWQFSSPAIWSLYGRWWDPQAPPLRPAAGGALPFTGDYRDGLGNRITMTAYANPTGESYNGAGFGIVRFHKPTRRITMECWPRFVDVSRPGATQYPGWPITIAQEDNYGREALAWLPTLHFSAGWENPVVQIVDEYDGQIVYTLRIRGREFSPKVFRVGTYAVRIFPGALQREFTGVKSSPTRDVSSIDIAPRR